MTIRVLIADDHAIVREGIRLILDQQPDIEVVGEAVDGFDAVRVSADVEPDVVCMDLSMPGLDGMAATRRIRAEQPQVAVVALTVHASDEYFFEMIRAGAAGYVLKGAAAADLVKAVRAAAEGEAFINPALARKLVDDYVDRAEADKSSAALEALTPREIEIFELVAEGLTNKEIADRLIISLSTVQTHYANIVDKLGLSNRAELIKYAMRHGLGDASV